MALAIMAGVAVVGLGYSVASGEAQKANATQARRKTKLAQDEALRQQMIERQRSVQKEMKSDRATPASSIVMTDALGNPTDKTHGVDDRLRLARPTKLGGGT